MTASADAAILIRAAMAATEQRLRAEWRTVVGHGRRGEDGVRLAALFDASARPARAAEEICAVAAAGAALSGPAAERLRRRALSKLEGALRVTVLLDGSHASRSPQAALKLLLDLTGLEDGLRRRGLSLPPGIARARAALTGGVRAFTLSDGALAAFQGGEAVDVPAELFATDAAGRRASACGGVHRLDGGRLQVTADAQGPAAGPWSLAACGQPLAIEVVADGRRLISGSQWSPQARGPQAMRLAEAASTATLGDGVCGRPITGFASRRLGPRLVEGCGPVAVNRRAADEGDGLAMSHQGWARLGLTHERRLFLPAGRDELRGEDRFSPTAPRRGLDGRRFIPFTVRFHLRPQVSALVARDGRSVLIKADGDEAGWWLRTDAAQVTLDPSVVYVRGEPRRTQQVVLRGQVRPDTGVRVRWKLAPAGARVDGADDGP